MKDKFRLKCLIVLTFACIADVLAGVHIRGLVENKLTLAVLTVIAIQYFGFLANCWFIDETSISRRFWLTTSYALGAALGTVFVVLYT